MPACTGTRCWGDWCRTTSTLAGLSRCAADDDARNRAGGRSGTPVARALRRPVALRPACRVAGGSDGPGDAGRGATSTDGPADDRSTARGATRCPRHVLRSPRHRRCGRAQPARVKDTYSASCADPISGATCWGCSTGCPAGREPAAIAWALAVLALHAECADRACGDPCSRARTPVGDARQIGPVTRRRAPRCS